MSTQSLLLLAIIIASIGLMMRRRAGLSIGKTISYDAVNLYSAELGLSGRPDRVVKRGKHIFPEEKKTAKKLQPSHRAQMGVYFLLIEDHYGVRPRDGVVVLRGGGREKVRNTAQLRMEVLEIAKLIRAFRNEPPGPLPPRDVTPYQCSRCSVRAHCSMRLDR